MIEAGDRGLGIVVVVLGVLALGLVLWSGSHVLADDDGQGAVRVGLTRSGDGQPVLVLAGCAAPTIGEVVIEKAATSEIVYRAQHTSGTPQASLPLTGEVPGYRVLDRAPDPTLRLKVIRVRDSEGWDLTVPTLRFRLSDLEAGLVVDGVDDALEPTTVPLAEFEDVGSC